MTAIANDIDLFFQDPETEPSSPGRFGVLYLLRRDIKQCITTGQILWPATMAILAGIDLLGKFYAGEDGRGVGRRFRSFIDNYFQPISSDDAETIYQLRNALLHSFGLYSKSRANNYFFSLILPEAGPLVQRHPQNREQYLISITALYDKFETAIERYRTELEADSDLQDKFSKMFPYYGAISVQAVSVQPNY
jgi:hypothetical protein